MIIIFGRLKENKSTFNYKLFDILLVLRFWNTLQLTEGQIHLNKHLRNNNFGASIPTLA